MTNRPLAIYREGQLLKDMGGNYYPTTRFNVLMTAEMFSTRTGPDAERYDRDCRNALAEYDKAMEEKR